MAALYGCDTDLNQERVTLFRDLINLIRSMHYKNKKWMIGVASSNSRCREVTRGEGIPANTEVAG